MAIPIFMLVVYIILGIVGLAVFFFMLYLLISIISRANMKRKAMKIKDQILKGGIEQNAIKKENFNIAESGEFNRRRYNELESYRARQYDGEANSSNIAAANDKNAVSAYAGNESFERTDAKPNTAFVEGKSDFEKHIKRLERAEQTIKRDGVGSEYKNIQLSGVTKSRDVKRDNKKRFHLTNPADI